MIVVIVPVRVATNRASSCSPFTTNLFLVRKELDRMKRGIVDGNTNSNSDMRLLLDEYLLDIGTITLENKLLMGVDFLRCNFDKNNRTNK